MGKTITDSITILADSIHHYSIPMGRFYICCVFTQLYF